MFLWSLLIHMCLVLVTPEIVTPDRYAYSYMLILVFWPKSFCVQGVGYGRSLAPRALGRLLPLPRPPARRFLREDWTPLRARGGPGRRRLGSTWRATSSNAGAPSPSSAASCTAPSTRGLSATTNTRWTWTAAAGKALEGDLLEPWSAFTFFRGRLHSTTSAGTTSATTCTRTPSPARGGAVASEPQHRRRGTGIHGPGRRPP